VASILFLTKPDVALAFQVASIQPINLAASMAKFVRKTSWSLPEISKSLTLIHFETMENSLHREPSGLVFLLRIPWWHSVSSAFYAFAVPIPYT